MQPWRTLEEADTPDGKLVLRRRGERDTLLTTDGRVLMSSMLHRSEDALATLAVERFADRSRLRVLTAGLGLGFTLRALLDELGARARVDVAELHEPVVRWNQGLLAPIHRGAASDPRVRVSIGDVMGLVRAAAIEPTHRYDAIVLDLMEGPSRGRAHVNGRLYGARALADVRSALSPGGVYAVWGEQEDSGFVDLLMSVGFDARMVTVGRGAPRHVVYVAQPALAVRGGASAGVPRGRELPRGAAPSTVGAPTSGRRRTPR